VALAFESDDFDSLGLESEDPESDEEDSDDFASPPSEELPFPSAAAPPEAAAITLP
jgi:hypothetical protein